MGNRDEEDENPVALVYIQEVQGLEWLRGKSYKLNLKTRKHYVYVLFLCLYCPVCLVTGCVGSNCTRNIVSMCCFCACIVLCVL
jgi:hypothetical protein